ncbi:hypothetical protein ABZS95_10385 [Streptomyces sp. NPDC005479]|uniref:hypothetical protein n=1 Tax=Streptomyces sp. NPDC005479 TaxID=3154879 RepID=UPI0033BCEB75
MGNRPSAFAGKWTRPDHSGMGRSARELQDRASYDCAPAAGMGCLLALVVSLGLWAGLITAAAHIYGAIA